MKIEVISPLKCPQCKSVCVTKKGTAIHCDECKMITKKDGKTEKMKTYPKGKGRNPRYDTGDFLE
jgi:ribosomal protein L37AE/L43A